MRLGLAPGHGHPPTRCANSPENTSYAARQAAREGGLRQCPIDESASGTLGLMPREVSLVLFEGQSWPLRENILLNDDARTTFSPEEYGLSARLTQQLYDWTEWWHTHEMRQSPSHDRWAARLARDLQAELGPEFVVLLD